MGAQPTSPNFGIKRKGKKKENPKTMKETKEITKDSTRRGPRNIHNLFEVQTMNPTPRTTPQDMHKTCKRWQEDAQTASQSRYTQTKWDNQEQTRKTEWYIPSRSHISQDHQSGLSSGESLMPR